MVQLENGAKRRRQGSSNVMIIDTSRESAENLHLDGDC